METSNRGRSPILQNLYSNESIGLKRKWIDLCGMDNLALWYLLFHVVCEVMHEKGGIALLFYSSIESPPKAMLKYFLRKNKILYHNLLFIPFSSATELFNLLDKKALSMQEKRNVSIIGIFSIHHVFWNMAESLMRKNLMILGQKIEAIVSTVYDIHWEGAVEKAEDSQESYTFSPITEQKDFIQFFSTSYCVPSGSKALASSPLSWDSYFLPLNATERHNEEEDSNTALPLHLSMNDPKSACNPLPNTHSSILQDGVSQAKKLLIWENLFPSNPKRNWFYTPQAVYMVPSLLETETMYQMHCSRFLLSYANLSYLTLPYCISGKVHLQGANISSSPSGSEEKTGEGCGDSRSHCSKREATDETERKGMVLTLRKA